MEQWRTHYHDLNKDKEIIPTDDLKCYSCGEPFNYGEQITFVNADPYCSDMCFWEKQVVDESWSTTSPPTVEEQAEILINTFTVEQREAVKLIAELFELDLRLE